MTPPSKYILLFCFIGAFLLASSLLLFRRSSLLSGTHTCTSSKIWVEVLRKSPKNNRELQKIAVDVFHFSGGGITNFEFLGGIAVYGWGTTPIRPYICAGTYTNTFHLL